MGGNPHRHPEEDAAEGCFHGEETPHGRKEVGEHHDPHEEDFGPRETQEGLTQEESPQERRAGKESAEAGDWAGHHTLLLPPLRLITQTTAVAASTRPLGAHMARAGETELLNPAVCPTKSRPQ